MKLFLFLFTAVIGVQAASEVSVPETKAPHRFAELVSNADHATITVAGESTDKTIRVDDRKWIGQFSEILGAAVYQPILHVLAVGTPISFFAKNGKQVLSVQIFGSAIRLNSQDYEVGTKTCTEIDDLVRQKKG